MHLALAVLIALVPGAYAWWSGRGLMRRSGHPLFSELFVAHSGRLARVFLVAWIATLLLGAAPGCIGFGVALLAVLVGGFPARRHIFEERWGLRAYLLHHARVLAVFVGPWILVVFAPALLGVVARRHDGLPWIVGIGVAVLTTMWSFQSRALLGLLGATPLVDSALTERFDAVLRRARCKRPRIVRAGAPGGLWVNGWAFPNPWAPAVLLTDDLVRALAPDETTAIFAHEVAHLEEFTTRRWVMRTMVPALLVFVVAALLTLDATAPSLTRPLALGWPVIVLLALGASMSRVRSHETASDLRAVELTRDPEALVRALTTIHSLTRQPRRLPASVEARATHPSLARRIQAIRAHVGSPTGGTTFRVPEADTGTEAAPAATGILVRSDDDAGRAVALLADRLVWLEGVDTSRIASAPDPVAEAVLHATGTHTFPYAQLTELRVDASRPERPQLVFVAEQGKKHAFPLRVVVVETVQRFLDGVDGALAKRPPVHTNPVTSRSTARLAAGAAVLAGILPPWNLAMVLAGLVAIAWPVRATLVTAAATGLVGAALVWAAGDIALLPGMTGIGSPALLLGLQLVTALAILVLVGIRTAHGVRDARRTERIGIAVLLLLSLLGCLQWLNRVGEPLPEMQLHLWTRSNPTLLVLLVGSAAGLWVLHEKHARRGAAALVLAGVLMAVFGSTHFRDACTGDVLRPAPTALAVTSRGLEPVRTERFGASIAALELSPDGRSVAVQPSSDSRAASAPPYFVVHGPQARRTVEGRLLRWADSHTVVTVSPARTEIESVVVRQVDIRDGTRIEVTCPGFVSADLEVRAGRWWISSQGREGDEIVECTGLIGTSECSERRWPVPRSAAPVLLDTASDGRGGVLTCARSLPEGIGFASLTGAVPLPVHQLWYATEDRLQRLGDTALLPVAVRASPWGRGFVCLATTAKSTEIWEIDPARRIVTPRGRLAGSWYWSHTGGDLVLQRWGSPRVLIASAPERFDSAVCDSTSNATCASRFASRLVAARAGMLAVARSAEGQTEVTIYRLAAASFVRESTASH